MIFFPVFHVATILVFCAVFFCCELCTQHYQYLWIVQFVTDVLLPHGAVVMEELLGIFYC
jgi:hypothetical protein